MMILYNYLTRTVLAAIILVTLILIGVFAFIQLVNELSDIGSGQYGVWQAFYYVALTLPQYVYQFFPMTALIGCLVGLGTLASHSELIVMRASGMSIRQIIWVIVRMAIVLVMVVGMIGEWPAPWLRQHAQLYKQQQTTGDQHIQTQRGTWVREGNTFIHIAHVESAELLHGVTIYSFNKQHQLLRAQYAKLATLLNPDQWQLDDVSQSQFVKDKVIATHSPHATWAMQISPNLLTNIDELASPDNLNLLQLNAHVNYLKQNGLQYERYALSLWQRLLQPIAIVIMILLAIPFIFGPLRTLPMGYRIMTGVIVGFSFYFLNQMFGTFSLLYRVPPWLSALLPLLPFALLSVALVWRL